MAPNRGLPKNNLSAIRLYRRLGYQVTRTLHCALVTQAQAQNSHSASSDNAIEAKVIFAMILDTSGGRFHHNCRNQFSQACAGCSVRRSARRAFAERVLSDVSPTRPP